MNLFLAEIPVWNGSAETTLKYASGLGYMNGTDWYAPRIENPATYSVSLNAGGLASGSYGELTLVNVDGALDALADYAVDGRFLTLKYGDESAAYNTFITVLVAMMESISLERERVSIRLRDPARQLDKPITARVYTGVGGVTGEAGQKDTPKPILVGEALFIKPVLIDSAYLIYQLHDGQIDSISSVLNKAGQSITSGGSCADVTALYAATVTAGTYQWTTSPDGTYIRLGSDPAGDIAVTAAEYASGGNIGCLPGTTLQRLVLAYGQVLQPTLAHSGTPQAIASDRTTVTLAAGASAVNGAYTGLYLRLTIGDAIQIRKITGYLGSTKVATLEAALQLIGAGTQSYEVGSDVLGYTSERDAVDAAYLSMTETGTVSAALSQYDLVQLKAGSSSRSNAYTGGTITITSGTGSGQSRTVTYYSPVPNPTAQVSPNWTTRPDTTSVYSLTESASAQQRQAGVGVYAASADNLKTLMDSIAASVHAWYAFDATNTLRMGLFRDPATETAIATLTEDNLISLERVTDSNPESLPNWRVTVNSGKRWSPLNANNAVPASLVNLTKEWTSTSKQTDSTIKPIHKLSTERTFESLMIDADGRRAEKLATDLLALYKARHDTLNATVADPNLEFKAIDIGTVVILQVSRFGYNAGRKLRVISLRRDFQRGLLDLTLWG